MHLLRREAGVENGKPHASGRLYGIDNVSLSTDGQGGLITATLALNAFVFGSATTPRPARRRLPTMASAAAIGRRGSVNAGRLAAKQRRQKILVGVLAGVLAALLAYELPHLLGAPAATAQRRWPPPQPPRFRSLHRRPGNAARRHGKHVDPFAAKSLPNGDAHAVNAGGPDPSRDRRQLHRRPSRAGRPRAPTDRDRPTGRSQGRQAQLDRRPRLDPSGNGRPAALSFARGARRSVGGLSVLNSSNRASLRGGYWVVYSGPTERCRPLRDARPRSTRPATERPTSARCSRTDEKAEDTPPRGRRA